MGVPPKPRALDMDPQAKKRGTDGDGTDGDPPP